VSTPVVHTRLLRRSFVPSVQEKLPALMMAVMLRPEYSIKRTVISRLTTVGHAGQNSVMEMRKVWSSLL